MYMNNLKSADQLDLFFNIVFIFKYINYSDFFCECMLYKFKNMYFELICKDDWHFFHTKNWKNIIITDFYKFGELQSFILYISLNFFKGYEIPNSGKVYKGEN